MRITPETLARAREEKKRRRAAVAAAFEAGPLVPRATPAIATVGGGLASTVRSVALGVGSFAAFAPAALLADGRSLDAREAARNVIAVLLLTLAPALSSARAEGAPEAEELPRAKLAGRFSPLVVGFALVAFSLFPWFARWTVVEVALVLQAPLAFFLYVPRARACHLLVAGLGSLATTVLDDRGAYGLAALTLAAVLGAALDRATAVRRAANQPGPPALALPIGAAVVVSALGASLLAVALAALPPMERRLPETKPVRASRTADEKGGASAGELLAGVAAIAFLLGLYQFVAEKLGKKRAAEAPPVATAPSAPTPLGGGSPAIAPPWPASPRLAIVRRYLEHLAALARLGVRRAPGDAPLAIARATEERAPAATSDAVALARAFHVARYSPEAVSEDDAQRASAAAQAVEDALRER